MIYYIFDVKDPRVFLEASTGFYLFIVPGYCLLKTLGRFDNTGRKLELIAKKIETF